MSFVVITASYLRFHTHLIRGVKVRLFCSPQWNLKSVRASRVKERLFHFFGKHIYRLRTPLTANDPELVHRPRAGPAFVPAVLKSVLARRVKERARLLAVLKSVCSSRVKERASQPCLRAC